MLGVVREERKLDEQLPSCCRHEDLASIEELSTRADAIPYISLCEVIVNKPHLPLLQYFLVWLRLAGPRFAQRCLFRASYPNGIEGHCANHAFQDTQIKGSHEVLEPAVMKILSRSRAMKIDVKLLFKC